MNRIKKIGIPVAIIGAGVAVVFALGALKPEPEKKEQVSQAPSLFVENVLQQDIALTVSTQTEVKANTEVNLTSQISGMIKAVSSEYVEGGSFDVGETLVWIDDTDYQLALKRAKANVAAAKVRVEQAEADAEVARYQLRGVKNPTALALKKPQLAEAKAGLEAAEADLAQAEINLSRTRISLPFKGRLQAINVNVGQYIGPGTVIGQAFSTDKVKLRLPLTDKQLASLQLPIGFVADQGQELPVEFSATVAGAVQHWQGKLTRIDAAIDRETRLLYAVAEVENPYDNAMPLAVGLYVKATIFGNSVDSALVIPRDALRNGDTVYVVTEDNRLDIRKVDVLDSSPERVIVKDNLVAGEQVVVSPMRNPVQGMAVNTLIRNQPDIQTASALEESHNG